MEEKCRVCRSWACPGAEGAGEAVHLNSPGKNSPSVLLSFFLSFFVLESETGGEGRDLYRVWPETQQSRSLGAWRRILVHGASDVQGYRWVMEGLG